MSTRNMLKYFAKGTGMLLDFNGRTNSSLYKKYLIHRSRDIDAQNMASDWKKIELDILNSILKFALEHEDLQNHLVDITKTQGQKRDDKGHTSAK